MRGHRAHSAFMQLFGFLSLAARYAAIPADFIYNKGIKKGISLGVGGENMGTEWDIGIE